MSSLEYIQTDLPPVKEFVQQLRQAENQYDPVEKLLALERELAHLEQQYNLSSPDFYQRYQAGAMGDAIEFVRWMGRYKQYRKLKRMISNSLQLVLFESHEVPA
jgi:hypothetical protein